MPPKSEKARQTDFFDTCSQCKTSWSCCHETTPPVTDKRRKIIEAYLKTNKIDIKNPFVDGEYVFPRLVTGGYCIFHDKKTKKCLIHPVKPETCVAGPITFDIKPDTSTIEWFIKMDKICPLAGHVYKDEALLRKHIGSAKKDVTRLIDDLEPEALRAILEREEPETFKIGHGRLGKRVLQKLTQ